MVFSHLPKRLCTGNWHLLPVIYFMWRTTWMKTKYISLLTMCKFAGYSLRVWLVSTRIYHAHQFMLTSIHMHMLLWLTLFTMSFTNSKIYLFLVYCLLHPSMVWLLVDRICFLILHRTHLGLYKIYCDNVHACRSTLGRANIDQLCSFLYLIWFEKTEYNLLLVETKLVDKANSLNESSNNVYYPRLNRIVCIVVKLYVFSVIDQISQLC